MIGKLRHRITIQQKTRTADGSGGFTSVWSTFATRWAEVKPTTANQRFFSQKLEHNISHTVKLRHFSGVTSAMRVQHDSRTLQIHGIYDEDERGIWLVLMCEEGAAS